ncbi:methyltransferase domain-containing protein [Paenibacillus amylolyticus]|nr:methyltransferase domain-containing protein [Paenibacillus amylolyticus]WFR60918.1 methyltransferase domain-containing protein [Paenibacillus amylolyticus]
MSRVRIDLGSGENKHTGCIGIDKIPYATTDIVHDFNLPIPLEDNSVDMVMCSHSLQYVHDLSQVMKEIYRICRHGATVCIVVPYAHASLHMVNPQFKQQFNEHSPAYWTTQAGEPAQDDYELTTDPSALMRKHQIIEPMPVDFRLLNMEFFYFPAYHGLYNEVELGLLRQSQLNVTYQIMYHLLVVKKPISDKALADLKEAAVLEEPIYVEQQRQTVTIEYEDAEQPFNLDHLRTFSLEKEKPDEPDEPLVEMDPKVEVKVPHRHEAARGEKNNRQLRKKSDFNFNEIKNGPA